MKRYAALFGLFAMVDWAQPVMAHERYRHEFLRLPPPEARGCYYYRGERFCGRYCYIEANGMRYCRQRPRDAFPQAPVDDDFTAPDDGRRHHHTLK